MRILVTGGTSFVGAPLVRWLMADGHQVRVLVREESKLDRLKGSKAKLSVGDVRDPHAVSRAVFGCDSVIHMAYAPVSSTPREIMDVAVNGMGNVLRACELHGIGDLMLVSSPRADDGSYYGIGKMASEMMLTSRIDTFRRGLIARVYNAYGADMGNDHVIPQFITRMLAMKPNETRFPIQGSGCDRRAFIWTGDCTAQLAALYNRGGSGHHDVGDPANEVAIGDLARLIAQQMGRKIDLMVAGGCVDSADWRLASVKVPHLSPMLKAMPSMSFKDGLNKTVEWYREHQEAFA